MKQLILENKNFIKREKLVILSFLIFPFLWGIFYHYIACFIGIFFCVLLLGHIKNTKQFVFPKHLNKISFLGVFAGYIIACFFAVDKGIAILKMGKIATIVIFYIFTLQLRKEIIEKCIHTVSYTGIVMVITCIVAYFIPTMKDFFFQARRMGGFFQYSNTFAFFLLIGIILILTKENYQKTDILKVSILLIGLLWSGSRSVFLLFALTICILAWKKRKHRKWLLLIGICVIAVVTIYTIITKDVQNIGRIFTTSLQSSTFLGRLLYNIDAVQLLLEYPMGLGTLGYSYMQPAKQTGVYTTMFVHNDFLQIGLDGGMLAIISFFIWFFSHLFQKNISKRNRGILGLFLLHILVDFDLQYTYLFFLLILFINSEKSEEKIITFAEKKKGRQLIFSWIIAICSILLLYIGIANEAEEIGNYKLAVKVYPWNTKSLTNLMMTSETIKEVEEYADKILKQNVYSYEAYNMKAIVALEEENYKEMIDYKKKALSITKYEIAEYQDYVVMLKKAIDNSILRNDGTDYQMYVKDLLEIPLLLEEVKEQTHWLAWRLRDVPNLTLEEEYVEYIEWYRRMENE